MADSPYAAQIITFIDAFITGQYENVAVFSFVVYEYLVTFDLEVELFWRKRLTGASILFILNRYLTIAIRTSNIIQIHITSTTSCAGLVKAYVLFNELHYVMWGAFAALRAFALGRSLPVALVVGLFSIAPFVVNLVAYYGIMKVTGYIDPMVTACGLGSTAPITLIQSTIFVIVSRGSLIITDIIVLLVTWWSTYRRGIKAIITGKRTLTNVVLTNGIGYFLVMLALNVVHLSLTLIGYSNPDGINTSAITFFSEPITSVLVSRFLLDLQATSLRTIDLDSQSPQGSWTHSDVDSGTLSFATVIGSIASSLEGHGYGDGFGGAVATGTEKDGDRGAL